MNLVILPLILPMLYLLVFIFLRTGETAKRVFPVAGLSLFVLSMVILFEVRVHKILILQVGGWEAPYGITLTIDLLSSLILAISNFIVFVTSVYSLKFINNSILSSRFYVFFFALALGVNGALIAGDVFNLYVWFEVILISSFVLITLGKTKEQLEGGIKYMSLNLLGSLFFLSGIGLLYGKTGTLNMAHLAQILVHDKQSVLLNTSAVLFFIAFGIKAAVFPLFFWLPSSYHTPNITITALFAGLLTKVGVYVLFRFFTLFFVHDTFFWHNLLVIVSGLTMVIGGLAASAHYDIRKILSYHIISQIGYMIMALGIYSPLALAGGIYFIMHNMLAKTNTFLIAGLIYRITGTYNLKNAGGLLKSNPLLAVLFLIAALALAGIPPLSGFFAKFMLIKAGFSDSKFFISSIAILTSLLTLYSMIKIWNEAFLKKLESDTMSREYRKLTWMELMPSVLLATGSIALGIFAKPVFEFTMASAEQLLNNDFYIHIILKN